VGALGALLALVCPPVAFAKKPTRPEVPLGPGGSAPKGATTPKGSMGGGKDTKPRGHAQGGPRASTGPEKKKADADKKDADKKAPKKGVDKKGADKKDVDKNALKKDADKKDADKGKPSKKPLASHVVQKGQTLQRIARRYRVSVDALVEANALAHRERLKTGLELVIPERGREAEARKRAAELRPGARAPATKGPAEPAAAKAKAAAPKGAEPKSPLGKRDVFEARPKKPGLLRVKTGTEVVTIQLVGRSGKLVPTALPKLSKALRFTPTGSSHPIDPRLAALLAKVSDHFGGRELQIVSGFRPYSPSQHTPHSNHNHGKAVDFHVDGVPNAALRDFCRTFDDAGVGYYPNSSFVHLDVRSARTYWIDYSGPGEAPRYAGSKPAARAAEAEERAGDKAQPSDHTESTESADDGVKSEAGE
jgi:uncharacterized protein YcbK (DUF882 family)